MSPERSLAPPGDGQAGSSEGATKRPHRQTIPLLEWIAGGLGAVLVGGAIAYLVHHALARDRTAPDIRLAAERVLELQEGYLVQFRASNRGGSAAAELTIEGQLTGPGGETEASEAVLDYLPPRSDREGGLVFSQDPRVGQLSLRAKGYAKP